MKENLLKKNRKSTGFWSRSSGLFVVQVKIRQSFINTAQKNSPTDKQTNAET